LWPRGSTRDESCCLDRQTNDFGHALVAVMLWSSPR